MIDTAPDTCIRSEVDDGIEPLTGQLVYIRLARYVELAEAEAGDLLQRGQPVMLHAHIIGVVQVIDADNGMSIAGKELCGARTNETGGAGDQIVSHRLCLVI